MTQTEAESVKHLAKPCNETIGVITERECRECKGTKQKHTTRRLYGFRATAGQALEYEREIVINCPTCSAAGKMSWKWEPEEGQYFLCGNEIILLPQQTEYVRWFCKEKTLTIQYSDGQRLFAEYNYPLVKCIPILHWEELERVLEGVGYDVFVEREYNYSDKQRGKMSHCTIRNVKPNIHTVGKSRQEAAYKAVIVLGKKLREEKNDQ